MMIDWELIGCGVLIMFMIFIGKRLSLRAFLRYLREPHERTRVHIEELSKRARVNIQKVLDKFIADTEKSGEETRAKIKKLYEDEEEAGA